MKRIVVAVAVAMVALGAAACGNPCKKLAKAVCAKTKDNPKICAKFQAQAKSADKAAKDKCKTQLKDVDSLIVAEKVKTGAANFLKGLGNKILDSIKKPGTATPPPAEKK